MGLDSISAIALGLSLRLVIQASSPHPRVAGTLIGLWEGAVLYHFLERLPAGSLDPYLGLLVRVCVDFLITSSWIRQAIVLLWTAAGLVIADVTPIFWYDREMQRFVKRTERRLKEFRLEEFFGSAYERMKHFQWPAMGIPALASWRIPNAPRHARFFPIPPLPRIDSVQRVEPIPSPPPPAPTVTRTRIVAPGLSTPSVSADSASTSATQTSTSTSRNSNSASQTSTSTSRKSESVVSDQTVQTASALPSAMRRTHSSSKSSSSGTSVTFSLPPEEPPIQSVARVPSSKDIPVMDIDEPPTPTLTNAPTAASSIMPPSLASSIMPPSLASRFFTAPLASSLPPISAISVPRILSAPPPAPVTPSKPIPEPRPISFSRSAPTPAISIPVAPRPIPVVSGAMTPPPLRRHDPFVSGAMNPPPIINRTPSQPPIRVPATIPMPEPRVASQEPHIGAPGVRLNVDALPEIPPLVTPGLHTAEYRDSPPPPFSTLDPSPSFVQSADEKQGYSGAADADASAPDLSAYAAHLRPPKPTTSASPNADAGAGNRDSLLSQHSMLSTSSLTGHSRLSVLSRADVLRQEALAEERAKERAAAERQKALRERRYGDAVKWKVEEGERDERARRLHERAAGAYLKAHNELSKPPHERNMVPVTPDSANTSSEGTGTSTVDVHRLRVREAVTAMERAIRDALIGGGDRLRVVIGAGKGTNGDPKDPKLPVLKLALIRELEDHHLAASVDPNDPNVLIINLPVN